MSESNERTARRGRSSRREVRSRSSNSSAVPYIHRKIPVTELLSDEGAENH